MQIIAVTKMLKAIQFAQDEDYKDAQKQKEIIEEIVEKVLELPEEYHPEELSDKLDKLYKMIESHRMTFSLLGALGSVLRWESACRERGDDYTEYRITSDFGEHTFFFSEDRVDGRNGLCGGIVFHGAPGEYIENGSVSLNPQYGWQIHT